MFSNTLPQGLNLLSLCRAGTHFALLMRGSDQCPVSILFATPPTCPLLPLFEITGLKDKLSSGLKSYICPAVKHIQGGYCIRASRFHLDPLDSCHLHYTSSDAWVMDLAWRLPSPLESRRLAAWGKCPELSSFTYRRAHGACLEKKSGEIVTSSMSFLPELPYSPVQWRAWV